MTTDYSILIGTVGNSLQVSHDRGNRWRGGEGLGVNGGEGNVRALCVHPHDQHHVLAGFDRLGIFKSLDNGNSWTHIDSPAEGMEIWSIEIDYANPDNIFVGTRPEGFGSKDGGKSWSALPMGVDREAMLYPPRTTKILVDPRDHEVIWASTEVNGLYRSHNGGDDWERMPDIGPSIWHQDNHCLAIQNGDSGTVYVTGPEGLATSYDDGASWQLQSLPPCPDENGEIFKVGSHAPDHAYCRGMLIKADDPNVLFVGTGNTIPGDVGALQKSRDGGETWEFTDLPELPNSTVYWLGSNSELPHVIVAVTIFGYVYLSEDGGENWIKLAKEFGHIRTVAVTPH